MNWKHGAAFLTLAVIAFVMFAGYAADSVVDRPQIDANPGVKET